MSWSTIDNVKPTQKSTTVPENGVTVGSRRVLNDKRYIYIMIGAALARAARFVQDKQGVRLMVGSGADAGKIAIAIDQSEGGFVASRRKTGSYQITINRAAADGLFSLEFDKFTRDGLEAVRPENGQPPMFVFKATDAMLSVED